MQESLNHELMQYYEEKKKCSEAELSKLLISKIENIVEQLNLEGFNFKETDYSGDIRRGHRGLHLF